MEPAPTKGRGIGPTAFREAAVLLLICGLSFFVGIGQVPLHRTQEARVLECARVMRESGDLLVPRLCGKVRFQKPPLAYWLALAGYTAVGGVDEGAGRIYSALAGTLTVFLVWSLGRSAGSARMGLWAGAMLATSFLFFRFSRSAETDVLLTCGSTAALCAFWRAGQAADAARSFRGWVILAWGAMAVAFLAKGPGGLTYPLVPALLWWAIARRGRGIHRLFDPLGLALFAALAAPWFVAVIIREKVALSAFREAMATTAAGRGHGKELLYGIVYYLLTVWRDALPWCAFLPLAVPAACRRLRSDPLAGFLLAWAGGVLLQLEFVGNKQGHYLLPALPALALLVAWWLEAESAPLKILRGSWRGRMVFGITALTIAVNLAWTFTLEERFIGDARGIRIFARDAAAAIGAQPVYVLGEEDSVLNFYLRRVIPALRGEPGEPDSLEAPIEAGGSFFLITPGKEPPDVRLRPIVLPDPGASSFRLFGYSRR